MYEQRASWAMLSETQPEESSPHLAYLLPGQTNGARCVLPPANFVEEHSLLPPTILGFRAHLSTQDALIQLHHDLLRPGSGTSTKALFGLDLHKAFDNMKHTTILGSLSEL